MMELLKSFATPAVWIFVLMVLGYILASGLPKKRRYKLGRYALFLAMCLLLLLSTKPMADLLVYSLECQHRLPSDEILCTLDIVVILGGGMYAPGGFRKYPEASGITYSRVFNGVRIFKRSGAETLALCGGSEPGIESEAEVMAALALELAVQGDRIVTETRSHNTMENGAELAKLLSSAGAKRIGLVTSAWHMPRSVKVFQKQFPKDTIVPVPVDHIYSPDWRHLTSYVPSSDTLARSNYAIHEWIGMIWYVIRY